MDAMPRYPRRQLSDPFRMPAWRWNRARKLSSSKHRLSRLQDDKDTLAAVAYLRALAKGAEVKQLWPVIAAAQELAFEDSSRLWELRARLLAGQSDAEIGACCRLPVDVVRVFESLFFHVRDHLHSRDWILLQAITWGPWTEFHAHQLSSLWATFAYFGGPAVLDVIIRVSQNADMPCWPMIPDLNEGQAEQSARMAIAAHMIPTDAGPQQITALMLGLRRYESTESELRTQDSIQEKIDALAEQLSSVIAAAGAKKLSKAAVA